MGLHLAAGAMLIARPTTWPLALGATAANHAVLAGAGLWPRSRLLGPNWTRLPAAAAALGQVAVTIDDGPDRGDPGDARRAGPLRRHGDLLLHR
jgi:hypothetical protein